MPQPETHKEIGEQLMDSAVTNYVECLNLPPNSQVLIITDKPTPGSECSTNPDLTTRTRMSKIIHDRLAVGGYRVGQVAFDHTTSLADMYQQTTSALQKLNSTENTQSPDLTTTVVYLGDVWANRKGLYNAASDFGKDRKVKVAGSLGFSTGDCRVMSQLTPDRRKTTEQANRYFEGFFTEHPEGKLRISTKDADGVNHTLELTYNNKVAPFSTDLGWFDDIHMSRIGNFDYLNIPGGEEFAPPYPFRNSQGEFVAESVCIHVTNGMVDEIRAPEAVLDNINEPSQKLLISLIKSGRKIPLSEIGLGLYAIAGIETFSDSSTLSREKGGPHGGMGIDPSDGSPESGEMEQLAGDFHHTDFVMDNPVIDFTDPASDKITAFYPPGR